ncbi:MAG TPA: ATP-binding protein [Ktedonobacteraceae bacterium]|jgi:PAS domain S-box-containing protein|nr:ATP-binding protein [Ktedonobacteraceae bacterium]
MTINGSFTQERYGLNPAKIHAGESRELVDMLQKIVRRAEAIPDVHHCSIALLDSSGTSLMTIAALLHTDQKTPASVNEDVVGWVLEHRELLLLNDVGVDARFQDLMPGSLLCIPLFDAGRCIGVITASSSQANIFDTQKVQMLSTFAAQAELAILNARQKELIQHQFYQLEMQMQLAQSITTHLKPEALYRTILSGIPHLLACERATILLYHAESQTLSAVAECSLDTASLPDGEHDIQIFAADPDSPQMQDRISIHDTTSLAAWAAAHRHSMRSGSIAPQIPAQEERKTAPTSYELAIPLVSQDILYGVLSLKRQKPFTSGDLRLIRNLGFLAATSLEQVSSFHKLRSEQEQLRTIWAASSDGLALFGRESRVVEANASFERIFGLQTSQGIGMPSTKLLARSEEGHPNAEECQKVQQALEQQQPLSYVEIDVPLQGVLRTIGLSLTPISTAYDPLALMIVRDVTAIRDTARMKARFLSLVTHELRSPLNAINGYLDLTLNGIAGEVNEQQREFLQRARAGSEHLYALLEDLLLISRVDAGQLVLNRQVISLRDIVENAVEELDLTAVDGKVALEVDLPPGLPRIYADAVRIQQVLRNLLSNALRFTPEGGHVLVSVLVADQPTADPDEDARVVQLLVRDTGPGIAPEFLERIFERFYQVPGASGGRSGGQGLGLAVVKTIVELHGGSVIVESVPAEGSTFTCILPCLLS